MITVIIDEYTPCLKNTKTGDLETHNVYESSDLCIDIAAVIKYARKNYISLSAVPPEIIEQYSKAPSQLVG